MSFVWGAKAGFPVSSVAFEPFEGSGLIAAGTCANFGFYPSGSIGGRVIVASNLGLAYGPPTKAAPLGVGWRSSEVVVACFTDGTVGTHHLQFCSREGSEESFPVEHIARSSTFKAHSNEASSVAISSVSRNAIATVSWDGSVLFLALDEQWSAPRRLYVGRSKGAPAPCELHDVCFSPSNPFVVVAGSSDCHAYICDSRAKASYINKFVLGSECLSVHWAPHGSGALLACGLADGTVSFWDDRRHEMPLSRAQPHSWGVRGVRIVPMLSRNPVEKVALLSASYDMSCVLSLCALRSKVVRPQLLHQARHTEFAIACDINAGGTMAVSGAWDARILVYNVTHVLRPSRL